MSDMRQYHLIQGAQDEWLTTNDTTAEMAEMEGCQVTFNLSPEQLNECFLEYHAHWTELIVK